MNDPEQIIIVSDTIFLGDHNHSETMYALDSSSGNPIWEYTPPILDGSALINDYVVAENSVYLTTDDKVTALDLLTGELLWQVELDNEIEYASSEAD